MRLQYEIIGNGLYSPLSTAAISNGLKQPVTDRALTGNGFYKPVTDRFDICNPGFSRNVNVCKSVNSNFLFEFECSLNL
jgi:hypothetical protein